MQEIYGKAFDIPAGYMHYQPVFGQEHLGGRECQSRLDVILEADRVFDRKRMKDTTIIDVGCNLGWFLFELERLGVGNGWVGIEREDGLLKGVGHIAKTVKSNVNVYKSTRDYYGVKKATAFFLSVSHHIEDFGKYLNRFILDYSNCDTIYIEQATHLEYADWAKGLKPDNYEIPAFYWRREFERMTGDKFICRLIGTSRTHLNTIRYMYQLKRKINRTLPSPKPLNRDIYDAKSVPSSMNFETIQVCDIWDLPYLGSIEMPEAHRLYMKSLDEKEFYKIKGGKLFKMPWIDGVLLVDALRWGILPFMDLKKIRAGVRDAYNRGGFDARPHNIMLDEHSNVYRIDEVDDILLPLDPNTEEQFQFFLNLL